jgi:thiamine transport system substrate-binding protein
MKFIKLLLGLIVTASIILIFLPSCSDNSVNETGSKSKESCLKESGLKEIKLTEEAKKSALGEIIDLVVYDAFLAPEGVFERFKDETGITVNILTTADTGTMVSQAVLTSGNPVGDVMFGIDNTFLCKALNNDVFVPYKPGTWNELREELKLDASGRVVPVDYGDICLNYWKDSFSISPTTINDLATSNFSGQFVTQNPETSAPGMGFLLSTIAVFGDDWEDFWTELRSNDVAIRSGWSEAYYEDFYSKDRKIVTSYATSPVAEYIFADPPVEAPPTAIITDSCFRSIEFTGILRGTDSPIASAMLVDFLTSVYFQEMIPETNFVLPANVNAKLPEVFLRFLEDVPNAVSISPDDIDANRNTWTERWTELVLR